MEIEAKFAIPDDGTFGRLLAAPDLAGCRLGPDTAAEMQDEYLDTPGRAFLAAGLACRLRREEDRTLITLKGLGSAGADGIHRRLEHEFEVAGPLAPRDWPPGAARDLALQLGGDEPLIPLFALEQTRYRRPVLLDGSEMAELSLDRVAVCLGGEPRPAARFLVIEIEMRPGAREEDLAPLAAALRDEWRLRPERLSKFERGLALLDGRLAGPGPGSRLLPDERAVVERLAGGREAVARRARLLLAWDDGASRAEVLARAGLSPRRAVYWLNTFRRRRLGIFGRALATAQGATGMAAPAPDGEPFPAAEPAAPSPDGQPGEAAAGASPEAETAKTGAAPAVKLLKAPGLEPDDPMSEAGRKILRFHFRRMLYHEPGTRRGEDAEALHDMRVATRRMRAALRTFGSYYEPDVVARFEKRLRDTGRALGAVRDLDVFREKIQAYLDTLPEAQRDSLDPLLAVLEQRREAAREAMIGYLDGKRYARFTDEFGEFVETAGLGSLPPSWDGEEPRPYRLRHVAPVAVYDRLAAVRAYDEWVAVPQPPVIRLHALRIGCKRLRYALEFFREVLGPDTKALIDEVTAMQDHLGALQDAVVASGILRDFLVWGTWGHDDARRRLPDLEAPVIAPGVAAYLAVKQTELQTLLETFPAAWERLRSADFSRLVAESVSVL